MNILLCSQILWIRNSERAQRGQMFLVPQCFEPQLGVLRDDRGLEHLGLGDLFPRWLPHSYSGFLRAW